MLREHHYVWRSLFIAVDLSLSGAAFAISYVLRFSPPLVNLLPTEEIPPFSEYAHVLPGLLVFLWITNNYFKLYHPRRILGLADELAGVVKSSCLTVLLLMTLFFFLDHYTYARSVVLIFAALNPAVLSVFRLSIRSGLRSLRSRGYNLRHILIIGTGRMAQALIHRVRRNPWTGMRVRGLLSQSPERVGTRIHGVPVLGTVDDLDGVLERASIDHVYVALPASKHRLIRRLVTHLSERLIAVRVVPEIGWLFDTRQVSDLDGVPIFAVWENRLRGWNAFAKRALDMTIASASIFFAFPLFLVIALLVKCTSKGPVFYVQQRMGLDGRVFPILKFRTMRTETSDTPKWTVPDDERCTRFGRILRRTSLDELPQLFNVLVGHMSMVGPRPERPVLIEQYRMTVPRYMLRHQFKAGITGWAQVNGWRGNTSLRKRIQYDLYYLEHWSIWFDIKILGLTLVRGLLHRNAY